MEKNDEKQLSIVEVRREIDMQLADKETVKALVETTFKGLDEQNIRQAMLEGMLRGFKFKEFLQKDVYAVPFRSKQPDGTYKLGYTLVTSIDRARKIGMRSGITGEDAPVYEESNHGGIMACSVTVHRKIPGGSTIGDFTAKVYFSEYVRMRNGAPDGLWASKPRTMLAKVAEMHALRKACPEELAEAYVEEEFQKTEEVPVAPTVDLEKCAADLKAAQTIEELREAWANLPAAAKADPKLIDLKEGLKQQLGGK